MVNALAAADTTQSARPDARPAVAKACGSASMPVPIIVLARLKTDDATEALPPERTPPRSSSDGESAEFLRRASVVGGPEIDSVSSIAGILRRHASA